MGAVLLTVCSTGLRLTSGLKKVLHLKNLIHRLLYADTRFEHENDASPNHKVTDTQSDCSNLRACVLRVNIIQLLI